jgi:acyl-coenzyme A synthetase/AMP-(fatty) acid ligase
MSGIDHFLRWEIDALELEPSTRVAQVLPLAFDGSLMDFVALCCGGTLCLPPTDETVLDASAMARWLSSARIDILHYVPSMFRELISDDGNALEDLQLRYILLTGEKVLASDVRRWRNRCGDRTQLVNLYGPTETTLVKFVHFITADDADRGTIPIGRPMPGASALLLDAAGRPCTVGTAGEVYISTPYRSLGYWNRPDLTCERFVPNPFNDNPKDILYKTGDLARISENGDYEFLGRFDDQVKIRGIRIELAEIENIIRQHELVRDVAVIACNDQSNLPYLCAYVVTTRGLDESALHRHVVEHVPASMAPSMYKMVREIPRTYSGKADRRALTHIVNDAEPLAPRTPVEHAIARLWQELLGLEEIGVDDNFFTIGGHSLVAMRLLSRIKDTFQLDLALAEFVESPTISGQALAVTAGLLAQLEDGERSAMINEILTMSEDKVETALATET